MALQPVEWVLAIYYGSSAHRATYGRLNGKDTKYTKDYIQLSRKADFLAVVSRLFPVAASGAGSVALTYKWPAGTTSGAFVFTSADRPHLKWETSLGAPKAWKMTPAPSEATAETIPGDPTHLDFAAAENELELIASRGAGQPYLLAIKLRDEPNRLHLRAYLKNPNNDFAWADVKLVPKDIQTLIAKTSQRSALAWSNFQSGGEPPGARIDATLSRITTSANPAMVIDALDANTGRALADYLRHPGYGLFFEPIRNHDAWLHPAPLSEKVATSATELLRLLDARFPAIPQGDAAAETIETDPEEVEVFRNQIEGKSYEVPDSTATVKTRGSAQKAFADVVKANYRNRCAITGITDKNFLVASHIVPWSKDQSIRLDPANGICLSLIVDRAFEKGYLVIQDDHTIRIDWDRVGDDHALRKGLEPYEGLTLIAPNKEGPKVEYLQRRRALVVCTRNAPATCAPVRN
jgi:hypothetical protein